MEPHSLSIPDYLDKNLIGSEPVKTSLLACADGGTAVLLQVREPLNDLQHAEADEILYVVAGAGILRMRNQETKMAPGHFALVPRGVSHTLRRDGRNPMIAVSLLAGTPCTETTPPVALVPWKRDALHKSRSAAPGSQGATTENIGHI